VKPKKRGRPPKRRFHPDGRPVRAHRRREEWWSKPRDPGQKPELHCPDAQRDVKLALISLLRRPYLNEPLDVQIDKIYRDLLNENSRRGRANPPKKLWPQWKKRTIKWWLDELDR
jgi:hypothetical protein